ncbi:hypothetical protein [Deinococcus peraridilitoris]|uniref:Uncharacterized protein n=1 Tax=Deinococcus peraridilitoris (strain DSM 19664 / LMG 22246 / CIP 109416 / KR-200) TaxID=937777 RepID=L0A454_DEIPD|nr:hypothetical protein [Deinococcus peraridilitoris]AFZ68209.1 hypothetical protein Deipe_2745 [Deinococcus peraridilitoris DSM 19664]
MCQRFELLAEQSSTQFVACCEHGTVHLGWGGSIWLLSRQELIELIRLVTGPPDERLDHRGPCFVSRDSTGRTVLWSHERALAFTHAGYHAFRTLLLTARPNFERVPAEQTDVTFQSYRLN